jgi:hypothetical protein
MNRLTKSYSIHFVVLLLHVLVLVIFILLLMEQPQVMSWIGRQEKPAPPPVRVQIESPSAERLESIRKVEETLGELFR